MKDYPNSVQLKEWLADKHSTLADLQYFILDEKEHEGHIREIRKQHPKLDEKEVQDRAAFRCLTSAKKSQPVVEPNVSRELYVLLQQVNQWHALQQKQEAANGAFQLRVFDNLNILHSAVKDMDGRIVAGMYANQTQTRDLLNTNFEDVITFATSNHQAIREYVGKRTEPYFSRNFIIWAVIVLFLLLCGVEVYF